MTTKNAIVGYGRSVHGMRPAAEGQLSYEHIKCGAGWTNAGGKMVASKIRLTEHAVTCKRCLKIEAQEVAAAAVALAIPFNPAGAAQTAQAVAVTASIASGTAALASATGTETVYVVHTCEGNTFEAAMTAAQAQTRLAKLLADPHVSDARIEGSATEGAATPKLTAAQSASLALVAEGSVSYSPGRTGGASSNWTRYSYHAQVGGKSVRRTKSVDALVELGLAALTGSAERGSPVVLTEAGRKLVGVEATPVAAVLVRRGSRIRLADGTSALVSDFFVEHCKHVFRLRLSGGLYVNHAVGAFDAVPVLS